ncbi:nacht and tpr domain protein [Neofusicoccum parvum]|nr:nacht and tpr domain protein [Neofusicoccum parvum]
MGDDPESEGNLEEAFQLAMEEYTRRTGIRIKDEHPQTVEEMRRQMVKFGTGGMHAQGVEAAKTTMDFFAWPPAAVCFKATQLVIETAQNYRKNFTIKGVQESLDSILTVVNDVARYVEGSKRGAQLDAELQNIVLRRLAHFLNVCAIYTKVQKDSRTILGSVKNVFKSVAGNDGGLQNELSQIEGLQKREEHVLGAKVFINTSITGNFLELQNRDTAKNHRRVAVKKILGFDEKNSAWNSWNDMHSNLKKGLVEKTGTWLLQDDFFRAWVDTEKALAKPVLALKGPTGTGKSHLCYSVVDHLYREYQGQMQAAGQTWQASIAYFYFERLEKGQSKSKDKRETSIRDALAALIWQITENDVAYQNFVSDQRISPSGFSTDDLWDNLITKFSESIGSKRRKVFFLVLDGVDQAKDEDIARTLSSLIEKATQLEKSNFQVRFFFTGTEKVFNAVSSTADESIEMIGVPERNREDIHLFIRTRIDKFRQSWKIGKDQDDLLDKLEAKLKDQSSDNFHEAISSLEEIRETKGSHELKEILNREAGDRSAAAAWQLKRLNRNLTEEEIEEFNDILVCMVLMTVWPTVQQLETFRLLRGASRDSIRLGTQIQEKYSQFFDVWDTSDSIDDKNRFVRSKATLDYFMELEGERSHRGSPSDF